jgi:periplasmic divalent cation tolerance protein
MAKDSGEVEFVQVATTFDAVEEAEALASSAVQARLAACAQSEGPITSVYWWDGAVQRDKEWRVTFKTTAALASRLTEYIVREHSYDVPEVLVTPVIGGHQKYLEWVQSETQQKGTQQKESGA